MDYINEKEFHELMELRQELKAREEDREFYAQYSKWTLDNWLMSVLISVILAVLIYVGFELEMKGAIIGAAIIFSLMVITAVVGIIRNPMK